MHSFAYSYLAWYCQTPAIAQLTISCTECKHKKSCNTLRDFTYIYTFIADCFHMEICIYIYIYIKESPYVYKSLKVCDKKRLKKEK